MIVFHVLSIFAKVSVIFLTYTAEKGEVQSFDMRFEPEFDLKLFLTVITLEHLMYILIMLTEDT